MERLDRFTDPFDGPQKAPQKFILTPFGNRIHSEQSVCQQSGNITLKTIPCSRLSRPSQQMPDVVKAEDIDWNSLVDVLDEAAHQPSNNNMACSSTPRPVGNLSVTVLPTPYRLLPKPPRHKRFRTSTHEDPYEKFLKGVFNDAEPGISEEESDDEDYTVAHSTGRGDEEDEYRDDESVQISIKELLDLFEDEYFVRKKKISVDRLRKRLEHLDEAKTAKVGFSAEQIDRLDDQICLHIQLVVQSIAFCSELDGAGCLFAELGVLCNELREICGTEVATDIKEPKIGLNTTHMPSLDEVPNREGAKLPSPRLSYYFQQIEFLRGSHAPIFHIPIPVARVNLRRLVTGVSVKCSAGKNTFSDSYYTWLALFHEALKPEYSVQVQKKQLDEALGTSFGDRFTPWEDNLLLFGLKKYGVGNWDTIQSQLIPSKTSRQLQHRFKNMSCRRAYDNPLKSFFDELVKPLSRVEEELLYRGVQRFSKNFEKISVHFLPHRPAPVLRYMWEVLDDARRKTQ